MAKFKASDVEAISWDVQGTPKLNPETGEIDGRWRNGEEHAQGTLTEPTPAQVQEYIDGWEEMLRISKEKPDDGEDETHIYMRIREHVAGMLLKLGFPEPLVHGLAPRHFRALADHVYEDLLEGN
jgi:hypothetical protein